jgi:hypothetical protein
MSDLIPQIDKAIQKIGIAERIIEGLIIAVVILLMWVVFQGARRTYCHGQCPHDQACQDRCFKRGYCPAEDR